MSKKIVLVSDNHFNNTVLHKILIANPDADYYMHCGDSEMSAEELGPFTSVRGNNDYDRNLPMERLIQVENKRILLLHGHRYLSFSNHGLVLKAQEAQADIVFYGHTHVFADFEDANIRFVNPGSCAYPRDGQDPCYAVVLIDGDDINVQRVFL